MDSKITDLRVLIIDDSESDAALIEHEIRSRGFEVMSQRVDTSRAMREALHKQWHIIISDFRMPQFNAITALEILRETGRDIPFILVSQAIGEGVAVELMRAGAADYVMKSSLKRLGPAVEREVREARVRVVARKARENLVESERRLRAAQSVAKLGSWETNLSTLDAIWSEEVFKIFDLDPATFAPTHKTFLEYVHPEDRISVDGAFRASIESGGEHAIVHRIVSATGHTRFVEERWSIENDHEGRPLRAFGTCQDITASKHLENQLLEREAYLNSIIASQISGIVVVNGAGAITTANESAREILELQHDAVTGRYFQDSDYWRQIDRNFETLSPEELPLSRALGRGEAVTAYEHGVVFPDGNIKWISVSASPIVDGQGNITGAVASFLDITEVYSQRERNLQQLQRMRLQDEAINSSLSGVIIADARLPDIPVTYVNRAFSEITGYSAGDVIGRNCRFLHGQDSQQEELAQLRSAIREKRSGDFLLRNYRKDGRAFMSSLHLEPVKSHDGIVTHFVAIQTDVTEKVAAERELEMARERMQLALEGARLGLIDYRVQEASLFINDRFAEILGYDREELLGLSGKLWNLVHPDDRAHVQQITEEHLTGRTPALVIEHRMLHRDGSSVWVLSQGRVVERDTDGKPLRYAGTLLDTSAIHRAENELRSTARLLHEAQRIARMGAWELDINSGMTTWTDEVYRIHELEPSQQYAKDEAISFYHPDDRPLLIDALNAAVTERRPFDLDLRFRTAKGRDLWVHASGFPVMEDDRVAKVTGMFHDITDAKLAELQLQQSRERLELALRGGDLGLWDWDIGSDNAYFDERWCSMLGYTRDEVPPTGAGWRALLHPDDMARVTEQLEILWRAPKNAYEVEFRMQHKDSSWIWILARGRVVECDQQDKPLRMVGTHMDVTLRKSQEARILELSQRMIEISELERAEISSELHDVLGQSLVLMKLNLQRFLGDNALRTPANEKLLLDPVADTLKKAREISRRLTPSHMKKVGLVLALEDMLHSASSLSGVHIEMDLAALEGFFPENWNIACYRVIQESVTNALKHSGASTIQVRARRVDSNMELRIADNGRGFSDAADANGIGLTLMRERVRGLRGHLFFDSAETGLSVVVLIPRQTG